MARVQTLFIVACLIVSACSGGNVPAASTTATPSANPSPIASASAENSCNAPKSPPSTWPAEAVAALEAMTARYMERCATTADFELYFSLPEGLTATQETLTKKWYSDALTAATRVFGDLLQSTKPIAVFYKTSAESMCTELVAFLEQENAAPDVIGGVKTFEWSCKPNTDWEAVYKNPGYGATILEAKSLKYDYLILNMGNGDELRSKDPYAALNPTFQTPSHELFHLAQAANKSQGATLWWAEGGAAYVGHLTAAMQGMVSYKEARDQALVTYTCEEIARNGKTAPPSISVMSGWWDDANGKWWKGLVYYMGGLASEYVLGTYGWDAFYTWASGFETPGSLNGTAYLDQRSQQTFGISLDELHKNIDKYLERVLSC
ncbi:MAG: hypothetical protein ACKOJD_09265 [Candidatus Limnocylindrus sp.]